MHFECQFKFAHHWHDDELREKANGRSDGPFEDPPDDVQIHETAKADVQYHGQHNEANFEDVFFGRSEANARIVKGHQFPPTTLSTKLHKDSITRLGSVMNFKRLTSKQSCEPRCVRRLENFQGRC